MRNLITVTEGNHSHYSLCSSLLLKRLPVVIDGLENVDNDELQLCMSMYTKAMALVNRQRSTSTSE
jgi:hypothetical protein